MNPTLKKWAVPALHWILGVSIFLESVHTAASSGAIHHFAKLGIPPWVPRVLGSVEAIAAILLLIPVTTIAGGYALLVIFALAAVIHLLHGQHDEILGLLLYAAAVLVIMAYHDGATPEPAHDRR
jgi:hypothetical protein